MTVQTTYVQDINAAFAGATSNLVPSRTISLLNPSATNVHEVTIDTVTNATLYTITINGVPSNYTSDGSATEAEIHDNLIAQVNANPLLAQVATASPGTTSADIFITSLVRDVTLVLAVSALLSVVETTAAGAARPYGRFYGYGTVVGAPSQLGGVHMIELVDANTVIAGVLRHTHGDHTNSYPIPFTNDIAPGRDLSGLPASNEGSIQTMGHIWVEAEEAFTPGLPVFARHTAGAGGATIGRARTDADTASAVLVPGVRAEEYRANLGLVRVSLSLPG